MRGDDEGEGEPGAEMCPGDAGTPCFISEIIEAVAGDDEEHETADDGEPAAAAAVGAPGGVDVRGEEVAEADHDGHRAGGVNFQEHGLERMLLPAAKFIDAGEPAIEDEPARAGEEAEQEKAVEEGLPAAGKVGGGTGQEGHFSEGTQANPAWQAAMVDGFAPRAMQKTIA